MSFHVIDIGKSRKKLGDILNWCDQAGDKENIASYNPKKRSLRLYFYVFYGR